MIGGSVVEAENLWEHILSVDVNRVDYLDGDD